MSYTKTDIDQMSTADLRAVMADLGIKRTGRELKPELQAKVAHALGFDRPVLELTPPPDVPTATCPKCSACGTVEEVFGFRCIAPARDGKPAKLIPQSWCRDCRKVDSARRAKDKAAKARADRAQAILAKHGLAVTA